MGTRADGWDRGRHTNGHAEVSDRSEAVENLAATRKDAVERLIELRRPASGSEPPPAVHDPWVM
jgi:hypothetical protein